MTEGDVVRIVGKVDTRIKDAPAVVVGTFIGFSGKQHDATIGDVLSADGIIYRVKLKDIVLES